MKNNSGIYVILNIVNDKIYVGSAKRFYQRWHIHKSLLKSGKHYNKHLQSAWITYGEENFIFVVLECCAIEKLIEREQFWIDTLKPCDRTSGYNSNIIANSRIGTKLGRKLIFTEEHKRNISLSQKGRIITKEHGEKIGEANKKRVGVRYNKVIKWPCPARNKCNCENCLPKRNAYMRNWKLKRKQDIAKLLS